MRLNRYSYYIMILLILFTIIIGIILALNYFSSVEIHNEKRLIQFIEKKDKVNNISIVKESDYQEIHCILYTFNGVVRLFILEKNLIPNRYEYFGGSYGSTDFGTYNYGDNKGALIIVYGDNTKHQAYRYNMKNGEVT